VSKNVDISILQLYYLFYSAEMLILMFNNNKYSLESHLVSLYTDLQKYFNKVEEEPTDQPPVRHFDPGAPLAVAD
jgi:hypothetical protein